MSRYPRNEKALVRRILSVVQEKYGGEVWSLNVHGDGYQRPGIPDLLFVKAGRMVAMEVKHQKPGESSKHLLTRVSAAQERELENLRAAGALAEVVWEVDQALELLERVV